MFKGDAFASYDQKIDLFRNQISELGIQLASKSSIREAAKGAAVGAGIQLLATRGKAGLAGGVAGVVIGAALEEAKKAELRKQMLNTATEGVINIILELEKLAVGMLDQYSLLLMGNERSPSKLDLATDQLRSKIRLLHNNAQNLFRKTVDFNKRLDQVKEP